MKSIIVFLTVNFFLLFINSGFAQNIHGTVTDTLAHPISFAGISLKTSGNILVAYTSCNENGKFTLTIPAHINQQQPLWVEAAILGYKKQSKAFAGFNNSYNFTLVEYNQELKAVVVKDNRPALKVSGDTLSYKVSDFSTPQDRVIGDVIKKLPGIEVDAKGKISYNGKAISGFYIDGDNLLDDKYNVATGTVPNQIVENVQIIEKHQPIKILRNKSLSEDVALNITFKKDARLKLLGQAALGGGFPGQYDANVNGMTFKNSYKAINYVKANNSSIDVSSDLISHNISDYIKRTDSNKPGAILSLGTAGNPDLPKNRYLFNHSLLFNVNNLINIKKDVQLKANIYYLQDQQDQQYQKTETTYILNDTIAYNELQNNNLKINELNAQINMNVNKDKYYLNNSFTGNFGHHSAYSRLNANQTYIQQNLKENTFDFSNELNYLKSLGDKLIVNFYSYTNRITRPESRTMEPGLNTPIFNNGLPYKELTQRTETPTWISNNFISVNLPLKGLIIQQRTGFSIQSQLFRSDLFVQKNDNTINHALDSSSNNLEWQRKKFYTGFGIDVLGTKSKLNISLPFLLQQTAYHDHQYQLSHSSSQFYLNPLLQYKYQTGQENYLSFNYSLITNVGDINDVYRGYILKNYRTLFANNADLTEQKNQTASLGFYYRKAIKLFFFNANITYRQSNANSIASGIITPDFQRRIVLPFNNETNSWTVTGTISKYLFFINTTLSCSPAWQLNKISLIQNGALLPYKTQSQGFNIGFETKVNRKLDVNLKTYFTHINSYTFEEMNSEFSQVRQHGEINYTLLKNLFINFSADYYHTRQLSMENFNYLFSDFKAQFNFSKRKISIEVNARNLFNTTSYNTAYLSGNLFSSSFYTIPGRMILGKIKFNY